MSRVCVLQWVDHCDSFTGFRSSMAVAEGGRGVERGLGQGCNRLEEGYSASSTRGLAAALGSRTQQGDCSLQRGWPAILECDG